MHKRMMLTGLAMLIWFPFLAIAEVDCATLPHWVALDNGLQMNQQHVFCGEWKKNRPKGFHSRPTGVDPMTVARFTVQDTPNAAGVYTGRWSYQNHRDKTKFSSMFPDNCSVAQVLHSIAYAAGNLDKNCPSGAPNWTECGQNMPENIEDKVVEYCSNDSQQFTIGMAPPRNGKINTAFPIFTRD
jgi:hypothetical protein